MNNMKILFISLGCDKNLVDSEHMLGLLVEHGFEITDSEEDAEVIVINTCCFIPRTPKKKAFKIFLKWRSTVQREAVRFFW